MGKVTGAAIMARSLKQQGVDYMFGIVGFPVQPIAAEAQKAGIKYIGMRNEQSASYAAAGGGLPDRPAGRCPRRVGPGRRARPGGPRQRAAELLADDPDRRRVADLPERHGLRSRKSARC